MADELRNQAYLDISKVCLDIMYVGIEDKAYCSDVYDNIVESMSFLQPQRGRHSPDMAMPNTYMRKYY